MKSALIIATLASIATLAHAGGYRDDEENGKKYDDGSYKPKLYERPVKKHYYDEHDEYEKDYDYEEKKYYSPKKYGNPRYESESFSNYASNDPKKYKPEPYSENDYQTDEKKYKQSGGQYKETESYGKQRGDRDDYEKPLKQRSDRDDEKDEKESIKRRDEDEKDEKEPIKGRRDEDEKEPIKISGDVKDEKPIKDLHEDNEEPKEADEQNEDGEETSEEKERKKVYGEPRVKIEILKKCGKAMFPTPVLPYGDAKKFCKKQQARLLTLESKDIGCVNAVFRKLGVEKPVWIGSWNGDDYREAGIALLPGKQGGSVAVPRGQKNIGACELIDE